MMLTRFFLILGILCFLIALSFYLTNRFPSFKFPLGHLPGDFVVKRGNFSFYFPLTTCILISLVLALLLKIFRQ